ncbi:hypothetical protein C815_00197 [Firmicutes bacterium M10-2]|nr:hypothetical protein C815_00197 [Firmicutes bacterium M10-2]
MLWKFKRKPIVVTVHGFGAKTSHEMDDLAAFLKQNHYEVVQFNLYDIHDPNDAKSGSWIMRAEQAIRTAFEKTDEVYLIGFSMGGVIASYLATLFPVQCLILIAPAFHYVNLQLAKTTTKKKFSSSPSSSLSPSKAQTKTFTEIISQYKESITHIDCPILILHGTKDEVIDPSSSIAEYKRIPHDRKRLLFIEGAPHRMLYTPEYEKTAFSIILMMLQGKLM